MQPPKKDTEEYYKYWEARGYEFVEGRTVDTKTGNTKFIWIKRKREIYEKIFKLN
jgi:hypothetical protein